MNPLIVVSGHQCAPQEQAKWPQELVGSKAAGLQDLPSSWTPPYIVLTCLAYERWRRDEGCPQAIRPTVGHWLVTEAQLHKQLATLSAGPGKPLILRSSAPSETLQYRGQYESLRCNAAVDEVLAGALHLWRRTFTVCRGYEPEARQPMAIIVQSYVRTVAGGHLSNERRVSRRITDWVWESPTPLDRAATIFSFTVKKIRKAYRDIDLNCASQRELHTKLRMVAASTSSLGVRCHYEWVWDGRRLWIVQRDIESECRGNPPGAAWPPRRRGLDARPLLAFVEAPLSKGDWPKTECVRTFRACGLPTAALFVLEDQKILQQLARGATDEDLRSDLSKLLQLPIVLRTDIARSSPYPPELLPRTDALDDLKAATTFMANVAIQLTRKGLSPNQFCFIAHRFIPARSCALTLAKPGIPRVRIDSTWGLPDGLLFYPHDSFEVDARDPTHIKRRLRCKTSYLDIDERGSWTERRSGRPWDWKQSLEPKELAEIAKASYEIASYLKKAVHIMFFAGVHPSSGYPSCLPWYYTAQAPSTRDLQPSEVGLAGKRAFISNEHDLSRLQDRIKAPRSQRILSIRLKPAPELIRSRHFIEKVARVASENALPVELEGSILSHIFYTLTRQKVRVKCVSRFEPKPKRRRFRKLVRDLIPLRIESHGEVPRVYKVTLEELLPLLKAKAVEEALELYSESDPAGMFDELADLLEVIQSTCRFFGRDLEELIAAAEHKRKKRGGFKEGIVLLETREVPLMPAEAPSRGLFDEDDSVDMRASSGKTEISISPVDIRSASEPSAKGKYIVIPLIPPYPSALPARRVIPLRDGAQEAVITYRQKEVLVSVQPITRPRADRNQLLLFPPTPD